MAGDWSSIVAKYDRRRQPTSAHSGDSDAEVLDFINSMCALNHQRLVERDASFAVLPRFHVSTFLHIHNGCQASSHKQNTLHARVMREARARYLEKITEQLPTDNDLDQVWTLLLQNQCNHQFRVRSSHHPSSMFYADQF